MCSFVPSPRVLRVEAVRTTEKPEWKGETFNDQRTHDRSSSLRQGHGSRVEGEPALLARGDLAPPAWRPTHGYGAGPGPSANRTRYAIRTRSYRLRAAYDSALYVRHHAPLRPHQARPLFAAGGGSIPSVHAALAVRGALRAHARTCLCDTIRHPALKLLPCGASV